MMYSKPQTMVTFIVDKEPGQIFLVHKNIACGSSPFFKAAFESQMIEGTTQCMRLEDVEVETFGLVVHWIYHGTIESQESFIFPCLDDEEEARPNLLPLAKLWIFAQRILMPGLQNTVVEVMWKKFRLASRDHQVELCELVCLEEEPQLSELFVLIAHHFAWHCSDTYLTRLLHLLPPVILVAITIELKITQHHHKCWCRDNVRVFYVEDVKAETEGIRRIGSEGQQGAEASV